ncbi:MAG: hypothetical protein H6707_20560 [Deltaproteobacteria bacterium]|nr:hypothetical protein [Deltaproteobacteria bacterium]
MPILMVAAALPAAARPKALTAALSVTPQGLEPAAPDALAPADKVKPRRRAKRVVPAVNVVPKPRGRLAELESALAREQQKGRALAAKVASLEAALAQLTAGGSDPRLAGLKAQMDRAKAQRRAARDNRAKLEQAIAGGLDPSLVASALATQKTRERELDGRIAKLAAAIEQSKARPLAERLADVDQQLVRLRDQLKEVKHVAAYAASNLKAAQEAVGVTTSSVATPDAPKDIAPAATVAKAAAKTIGLEVGFELSSLYNFRGVNVFRHQHQNEQKALFAPSLAYHLGSSGVSVGYWGAFQYTGHNQGELVSAGVGHKQELYLRYERAIGEHGRWSAGLIYYFYPFADAAVAGTRLPSYLEPALGLGYRGAVDLGVVASYYAGLQSALADRYLYIRPTIAKTVSLNRWAGVSLGAGLGVKVFNDPQKMSDNVFDFNLDCGLPLSFGRAFSITPALHLAWSHFDALAAGEEYMVWASVNFSAAL